MAYPMLDGLYEVRLHGKVLDRVRMVRKNCNRCEIINATGVVFCGDAQQASKVFDKRMKDTQEFCDTFAEFGYEIIIKR